MVQEFLGLQQSLLAITGFPMSAANFSYHAATGKLAVSPQTTIRNVAILNFNNTSGAITLID
jgi:hypothetical protein